MVQELGYEHHFSTMFQTSRQGMNAYGGSMHGFPFGYSGTPQHQVAYDYSGQYQTPEATGIPQSGSPSPSSWSPASMYHHQQQQSQQQQQQQQQSVPTTTARHTPPGLEDWHTAAAAPFAVNSPTLPVSVSQNGQSTISYRPSAMGPTPFSNMPPELGHYAQSTPTHNMMVPPGQSPSPTSGGSQHGGGMVNSPINRQAREPYGWMKKHPYQSGPTSGKTRTKDKYRIVYSEYQKVELEKEYLYSKYITIQRKAELARSIGLSERQVKIWFQNRRAKERKQKRKREDAMASVHSPDEDEMDEEVKIEAIKVEPTQDYMHSVNPHMHHHLTARVQ